MKKIPVLITIKTKDKISLLINMMISKKNITTEFKYYIESQRHPTMIDKGEARTQMFDYQTF